MTPVAEVNGGQIVVYQEVLRVVGAWLDEQSARWISFAMTPGGLSVRYQEIPNGDIGLVAHFSAEELQLGEAELRRRRGNGERAQGGYRDLLRALGYELEQLDVDHVECEELLDGFLVSCWKGSGDGSSIRTLVLGPKAALIGQARARRKLKAKELVG